MPQKNSDQPVKVLAPTVNSVPRPMTIAVIGKSRTAENTAQAMKPL